MILRSTLLCLTSLTAIVAALESLPVASASGASAVAKTSSHLLLAQATTSSPATNPAFPVTPQTATNTNTTVPNVVNAQPASTANALSIGSRGESVRVLQQQLQQQGYYSGPVDGLYGSRTQQAVQSFQKNAGVTTTGQVDSPTLQRLQTQASQTQSPATPAASNSAAAVNPVNPPPTAAVVTSPVNPSSETANPAAAESSESSTPGSATALEDAQARVAVTSKSANSVTQLLWPVVALMAVLGSVGVGFTLANRGKSGKSTVEFTGEPAAAERETPLPTVMAESTVPVTEAMPPRQNGRTSSPPRVAPVPKIVTPEGVTLNETTKLAKVNILDELVGDLQVPDRSKRRRAIWELGQRGNSSAIQPLVNAMVDADSKEKSLILAALSEIGIRSLKPMNRALAIALQDENADVRKNAIRDLTRIYDLVGQISQMLGHATEDEDLEVRQTAHWALEQLNRIRPVPETKSALLPADAPMTKTDRLSEEFKN